MGGRAMIAEYRTAEASETNVRNYVTLTSVYVP